jgi:hypothetical protein
MIERPIFIVGAPRSGTTLLAAMLAAHSRLSCGPETHFFRWLADADIQRLTAQTEWPSNALEFVSSISRTSFSSDQRSLLIDNYQLDRNQIRAYLQGQPASVAAMLSSVTALYMRKMGKQRWAEKTPDHIEHLINIRTYFPDAHIVRILRDPRDVILSLSKVSWGVSSLMEGILFWKRQDDLSKDFFDADPGSYTLRFEDLILSPEAQLEKLCQFLGEAFEPSMLDTSKTGKQVNSRNVAWKNKSSQPIDRSRIEVWRSELTTGQNALAEALLGDRLTAYGYPIESTFNRVGEIYPQLDQAARYSAALEQLAAVGIRFWKTGNNEPATVKIYLGDPENNQWFDHQRSKKLRDTLALSGRIFRSISSRDEELYWAATQPDENWSGYCAFVLKSLLAPYKIAPEAQ